MGIVQKAGGTLRFVIFIGIGVVLLLAIIAASLWGMDYGVEATVVDKDCNTRESTVTVQESVSQIKHTEPIAFQECGVVNQGNFAIYNIRSERLQVFDREGGTKLWDSQWLSNIGFPLG